MEKTSAEFRAADFGPVWLVGKKTVVRQGQTAVKFVKGFRTDGTNEYLQSLPGRVSPEGDIIIWMGEYDGETRSFTEIPGVFVKPGSVTMEEFDVRELPRCTMGICTITGKTRDLTRGAHNKLVKLMSTAGYQPDYSFGFSMEYYSHEKYEKDNDEYSFSYLLPCIAR